MAYGWTGKLVRNKDGRTGKIRVENGVGPALTLCLDIDGGGSAKVILHSDSVDAGEKGWEWWCDDFEGGARWISLGDHTGTAEVP